MEHKRSLEKLLIVAICLVITVSATGCAFDLGKITDENDFYAKFPSVTFIKDDTTADEVETKRLYNKGAVNDFVCDLENNRYKYMAVEVGEDLNVDEFAIFVNSASSVTLGVELFIADKIPEKIATGKESDDFYTEEEDGEKKKKLKVFDEPESKDRVAAATVGLKENEWKSFAIKDFSVGEESLSSVELQKGKYLLFRFVNNCVKYDEEGQIVGRDEYPQVEMTFTAMLIRVI